MTLGSTGRIQKEPRLSVNTHRQKNRFNGFIMLCIPEQYFLLTAIQLNTNIILTTKRRKRRKRGTYTPTAKTCRLRAQCRSFFKFHSFTKDLIIQQKVKIFRGKGSRR